MTETLARPNKYPANCVRCGGRIAAGEGLLARLDNGSWAADHPVDCPDKPMVIARPTIRANEDGIYRNTAGDIYKVQIAHHGSGALYAKRLVITQTPDGPKGTFEYERGAIHKLTADQRLSNEEAATYGRLYGLCILCGATLTDESSIQRGLGPVCARYV